MSGKPSTSVTVLDVVHIVISKDPAKGAVIKLSLEGSTDVDLLFDPVTLAKLQFALAKIDKWHADALVAQ